MAKQPHSVRDNFYSISADLARQQYNAGYAAEYRRSDDCGINDPMHTDLGQLLDTVSSSFGHDICVLDLGCGTGRYFHCLKNLKRLTGVDASPDMLAMAKHPVMESHIAVPVELIYGNIADVSFPARSFDLIYCLGVLGDFMPLDSFLLTKVREMLNGGGRFIFTITDKQSPQAMSWKRLGAQALRPFLMGRLKHVVDSRLRPFRVTEEELRAIMDRAEFEDYTLSRRHSPTGRIDFVCVASKAC